MFEEAKWIVKKYDKAPDKPAPYMRKTFLAKADVKQAVLYVCGLGNGVYTINGKPVTDDVLVTPITRYDYTTRYNTFDVTHLILEGKNAFGAILGNGWYNTPCTTWDYEKATWRSAPKLIVQLEITYADGSQDVILTDSSWKCADSPVVYNQVRSREIYDARLEIDGWDLPDFDDSDWDNVLVKPGPGGVLLPMEHPPIRIIRTIRPKKLESGVYDACENVSGWVMIRAKGESGQKIEVEYGEALHEDGSLDTWVENRFNEGMPTQGEEYTLRGTGDWEEWEPKFGYHGFRYMDVKGAPEEFELYVRVVHTDLAIIGDFTSSDDMLNKIHAATRRATLTNWMGIPTDCPQREQNGWTGDALLSAEQSLMNYDMLEAYRKWLWDFKDVQRPNGQLPGIVPTSSWGYHWGSGPAWDSALIQIPWYVYQIYGDSSIISMMWENMQRYMDYMYTMQEGYLVNYGLGDWCHPHDGNVCDTIITDTGYYYANAVTMAKCAKVLGEDASKYEALAKKVKAAFRAAFIKDGIVKGDNQTGMACAIYQGLYEPEEIPAAAAHLADLVRQKDYHIDCGILGTKYIFSALSENGYADVLYKMVVNPTMPSYAYWINLGISTLCENWEIVHRFNGKDNSRNHHMFSEVDMWFYKHLAGIHINENGLLIKPCFIDALSWVKGSHKGISVEWNQTEVRIKSDRPGKLDINGNVVSFEPGEHVFAR